MRIAFAIMKLFAGGGLQRDCVEIARRCRKQGHDVVIYTSSCDDSGFADDLPVVMLPVRRRANHLMQEEFGTAFLFSSAMPQFDLRVGFDKLRCLDVLYCADPSIGARMRRQPFLFLIPRYRAYCALERASFSPRHRTRVLLLSDRQHDAYRAAWGTPPARLSVLRPTMSRARRHPEYRRNGVREVVRAQLGVTASAYVWLAIGVQPRTKGFDRTLRALQEFPHAHLVIAGLGETSTRAAAALAAKTRRMGLASRVSFLGHREDVADLMAAADLLVHPARHDTTGTVILEAVVNGLPVVTTAACGYARHVADAGAGVVIAEPFRMTALTAALRTAEDAALRSKWSAAAARYGAQPFLYEGLARAAEIIMTVAAERTGTAKPRCAVGLVARVEGASVAPPTRDSVRVNS
jgi:UDP-glucose:(heptosyl)LPS alpha-1,3-glucosyltransferase